MIDEQKTPLPDPAISSVDALEKRPRAARRILVPAQSAHDWASGLADPGKQWRTGYSAKTLATCWQAADDFPESVRHLFEASDDLLFAQVELLFASPEWKVPLPGGSRASQTDLFALARVPTGLVAITVEGKVDEPFGPLVTDWLRRSDEGGESAGKQKRLDYLCLELGVDVDSVEQLRYQLLHRTVSALIEARRFTARHALMLVHSFSPTSEWLDDYIAFAATLGVEGAGKNTLSRVGDRDGVELHLGWCSGDQRWRQEEP